MRTVRCSLSFHRSKLDVLDVFAVGVRDGIYTNTSVFATPPITDVNFQKAIDIYMNTRSAYKQGGKAQKGPFYAAKDALMANLDTTASYVDGIALGDANIITIAGYVPTKAVASATPAPSQFTKIELSRGISGHLFAECENQKVVDAYVCIMSVGEPLPVGAGITQGGQLTVGDAKVVPTPEEGEPEVKALGTGVAVFDFKKTRKKKYIGLTPGTTYWFYFFGINSAGVGDLSPGKSIVCW